MATSTPSVSMKAGGHYNQNSGPQAAVINFVSSLLSEFGPTISLSKDNNDVQTLTIADYGAAQGGNSIALVKQSIEILREKVGDEKKEVLVVHTDTPENDYSTLFKTVLGPNSYFGDNVYPLASAISFYKRLLPKNSTHIGFTMTSTHWLSKTPTIPPEKGVKSFRGFDKILSATNNNGVQDPSLIPIVEEATQNQALDDWKNFLSHRAEELVPGGLLFTATLFSSRNYQDDVFSSAQQKLLKEGKITEAEYHSFFIPIKFLSIEQLSSDEVVPKQLNIIHKSSIPLGMPIWNMYVADGDIKKAARILVGFVESWSESNTKNWLKSSGRTDEEVNSISSLMYQKMREAIEENPELIKMMTSQRSLLVFQKKA